VMHHRERGIKYYTLAEKAIPAEMLEEGEPSRDEYVARVALMIARASRLVSPSRATEQWHSVGKAREITSVLESLRAAGALFALNVEGWKGKLYAPAEDEGIWREPPEPEGNSVRFLAPLDPLLWNRALFKEIYGHRYVWEIYKKPHERKYGYYCLPVIFNGNCVGLIEPYLRKKERILELRSFHLLRKDYKNRDLMEGLTAEVGRFLANLRAKGLEAGPGCPDFVVRMADEIGSASQ
jgi:uncharacterized protein YcaQ